MSNIVNEEINRMLYLFGYKPGVVISEQTISNELDEAGRPRKINVDEESDKIFDDIFNRVMKGGTLMFNEFYSIFQKYKNSEKLQKLLYNYSDRLKIYNNLSDEERNNLKNKIFKNVELTGDAPYEDSSFISRKYTNEYDNLKKLFSYESPFSRLSKKEKTQNYYNKAVMTKKLTDEERRYLSVNAKHLLRDLYDKKIIEKPKVGKMSADENENFEKLLDLFDVIKSQNNITMSQSTQLNHLKQKLSKFLNDNDYTEVETIRKNSSRIPGKRMSSQEKEDEYEKIKNFVIENRDIWLRDYYFLKNNNEDLFNELKVYWSKYSPKQKTVIPEPVIEPEIVSTGIGRKRGRPRKDMSEPEIPNMGVGVRGRRPLTPEQIKNRIEIIKNKFSETNKLDDKDYQFLYKYGGDVLKTMVRPKKTKSKTDFELNPEEIEYEPIGKLSDYWTTSSTLDYDYNYNK
jgi:hypothetical protein